MSYLTKILPSIDPVYVVDDDAEVGRSMCFMMKTMGRECEAFLSRDHFRERAPSLTPGCVLHDIRMPGTSPECLEAELKKLSDRWRVVPMSGLAPWEVLGSGVSVGFLEKPFTEHELLMAVSLCRD